MPLVLISSGRPFASSRSSFRALSGDVARFSILLASDSDSLPCPLLP